MDIVQDILKKYKMTVIFTGLFLVVWIVVSMISGNAKGQLREVSNQRKRVESSVKISQEKQKEKTDVALTDGGLNMERIEANTKFLDGFFKKAFTFSSLEEYEELRSSILDEYLLPVTSDFLSFYPEIQNEENKQSKLVFIPVEDGNYELKYESFVSHVVNIHDGEYTYLNDVTVNSNEKEYHMIVTCTIDENEQIVDIQGAGVQEQEENENESEK